MISVLIIGLMVTSATQSSADYPDLLYYRVSLDSESDVILGGSVNGSVLGNSNISFLGSDLRIDTENQTMYESLYHVCEGDLCPKWSLVGNVDIQDVFIWNINGTSWFDFAAMRSTRENTVTTVDLDGGYYIENRTIADGVIASFYVSLESSITQLISVTNIDDISGMDANGKSVTAIIEYWEVDPYLYQSSLYSRALEEERIRNIQNVFFTVTAILIFSVILIKFFRRRTGASNNTS